MATAHPHLIRRNAIYYWRRRLPAPLATALGRTHHCRSLHTSHPHLARRLASRLTVAVDTFSDQVGVMMANKKTPAREDLDRILLEMFANIISSGERARLDRTPGYWPWAIEDEDEEIPGAPIEQPEDTAEFWRTCLQVNDTDYIRPSVEKLLAKRGFTPPADDLEYKIFLRQATANVASAHTYDAERERGYYRPVVPPFGGGVTGAQAAQQAAVSLATENEPGGELLSAAMTEFIAQNVASRRWTGDGEKHAREALRLWLALESDVPFARIVRSDAMRWRNKLLQLPAMRGKGIYDGPDLQRQCEIRQEVERAVKAGKPAQVGDRQLTAQEAASYAKPLTKKTVNKYLSPLISFYTAKVKEGLMCTENPFSGVMFPKSERSKEAAQRRPWEPAKLRDLFASPAWTGCNEVRRRKAAGKRVIEDAKFWAPLIALYSGMRQEEICSLRTADVKYNEDAHSWMFHVWGLDPTKGKTANAARTVPVHRMLVGVGLIDYLKAAERVGQEYLFPEFPRVDGKADAEELSKWFTRYRKDIGVYEPMVDFHSFRHTFRTAIGRAYVGNQAIINQIMGHQQDEMTGTYFHHYEPVQLVEAVNAVAYSLDLTHLYPAAQPHREKPFS